MVNILQVADSRLECLIKHVWSFDHSLDLIVYVHRASLDLLHPMRLSFLHLLDLKPIRHDNLLRVRYVEERCVNDLSTKDIFNLYATTLSDFFVHKLCLSIGAHVLHNAAFSDLEQLLGLLWRQKACPQTELIAGL